MSKIIIYLGSLLVTVNTIIGLLSSNYLPFNWLSIDAILIINTILLSKLSIDNISNGYKISLSFIYPFLCTVSIVLALLSPDKLQDNYYLIGFIFIILIEVSLYLIAKSIKFINTKK
jgi:hypothetical protein